MPSRRAARARACRKIAWRLDSAADAVRAVVALVVDAVPPDDVTRDAAALAELADLLRDAAEAYQPKRLPVLPQGAPAPAS
jgi:hypothetical protein